MIKKHMLYTNTIKDFPMEGLEEDFDYSSDEEAVFIAKRHMLKESLEAIDFAIKEDPFMLVDNLKQF
jgi:hypothetical protein